MLILLCLVDQIGVDKSVDIAVHHSIDVARFKTSAVVFDKG